MYEEYTLIGPYKVFMKGWRWRYKLIDPDGKRTTLTRARYNMELKLNRYLLPSEIVHHINGNTLDDRAENLEIKTNPKHTSDHRLVFPRPTESKEFNCPVCNSKFTLTPAQLWTREERERYQDKELRGPFCSGKCRAKDACNVRDKDGRICEGRR